MHRLLHAVVLGNLQPAETDIENIAEFGPRAFVGARGEGLGGYESLGPRTRLDGDLGRRWKPQVASTTGTRFTFT